SGPKVPLNVSSLEPPCVRIHLLILLAFFSRAKSRTFYAVASSTHTLFDVGPAVLPCLGLRQGLVFLLVRLHVLASGTRSNRP
ncbi:hypothetical protein, partial [Streptomyces sp. NPDC001296]